MLRDEPTRLPGQGRKKRFYIVVCMVGGEGEKVVEEGDLRHGVFLGEKK